MRYAWWLPPIRRSEAERDHIVEALQHSGGVISRRNGAAARLGLKRTTLHYRMHKLGIEQKRVCAVAGAEQSDLQTASYSQARIRSRREQDARSTRLTHFQELETSDHNRRPLRLGFGQCKLLTSLWLRRQV